MPGRRRAGSDFTSQYNRALTIASQVDSSVAEQLRTVAAASSGADQAVIVVVGEVKRGKSSLVNAVVGRAGLSPVDVTVATATYLVIADGDPEGIVVHLAEDGRKVSGSLGDIPEWTTPPPAVPDVGVLRHHVQNIHVTVTAPCLGNLVVIDTPGTGGLDAAHAEIALAAAERASALLFVTDAGTPLSRVELDFLTRAGERVDTVIFALTKTGRFHGWNAVLQENRANLTRVAPRFKDALWVPVDSVLAQRALQDLGGRHPVMDREQLDDTDPDVADALSTWEESGVGELLQVLRHRIAPRAQLLASLNATRFARAALDKLGRTVDEQIAAVEADPAVQAAFETEQARLEALQNENRSWGPDLDNQFHHLRIDVGQTLSAQLAAKRTHWTTRFRSMRRAPDQAGADSILAELEQEMEDLAHEVLLDTTARMKRVAETLFGELIHEVTVPMEFEREPGRVTMPAPAVLPRAKAFGAKDMMDTYYGAMMGQGLAGMAAGPVVGMLAVALSIPAAPVAAAVGVIGGLAGMGARLWVGRDAIRTQDLTQTALTWMQEAGQVIRTEVERDTLDAKFLLANAFREALDQRTAEVRKLVQVTQEALTANKQEAEKAKRALALRRKEINSAAADLDSLLALPGNRPLASLPGEVAS